MALLGIILAGGAMAASERVAQALREKLPRYDASKFVPPAEREADASLPPAIPRTATRSPAPPAQGELVVEPGVVELQPFAVKEDRVKPRVRLPRLTTPEALRPGENASDPLLSATERGARLRRKHLGALDSEVLNPHRLFGDGRAIEAERRERFASQLNDLARAIELASAVDETPAEAKKLRELYLQLLMSRPK